MRAGKEKKTYSSGAWYFLAPAVIVLFLVGIIPLLFAAWNSLHEFILPKVKSQGSILGIWPLFNAPFIWFGNYLALLTDQSFREALLRTLLFLVINLPIQLCLGMAIALLLHKPGNEFLKKINRVALVIPLATTFAVVGLMGRLMFNRDFGVLNYFWSMIFGEKADWLADPTL
ncbi:MAG: sugar ABC transporter permease, partial [Candidatus Binatia bacterium]